MLGPNEFAAYLIAALDGLRHGNEHYAPYDGAAGFDVVADFELQQAAHLVEAAIMAAQKANLLQIRALAADTIARAR